MALTYTGVCTDDKHGEVWWVAGQPKDGGLQVFVVATQIYQGDQLGGVLTNLFYSPRLTVVYNLKQDRFYVDLHAFRLTETYFSSQAYVFTYS